MVCKPARASNFLHSLIANKVERGGECHAPDDDDNEVKDFFFFVKKCPREQRRHSLPYPQQVFSCLVVVGAADGVACG